MAVIRSAGNRDTELKLASIFRAHGIKGWRRHQPVIGKPDFAFLRQRIAVFVDGCFWHCCPLHGHLPLSNRVYWIAKLARNQARDRRVRRELRSAGWRVVCIWAHELKDTRRVVARVRRAWARSRVRRTKGPARRR